MKKKLFKILTLFIYTLIFLLIFTGDIYAQPINNNNNKKILSFDDDLSSYSADLGRFSTEGKIYHKKYDDREGFDIYESEAGSPGLRIVWPPVNMLTTGYSSIRISGSTMPESELSINGAIYKIFPTGAFSTMIKLSRGENRISVSALKNGKKSSYIIPVNFIRQEGLKSTPRKPVGIDEEFSNKSDNIFLTYPEKISFVMKGSPGAKAWFKIGETGRKIDMKEMDIGAEENKWGIRGIYRGIFQSAISDDFSTRSLIFYIANPQNTNNVTHLKTNINIFISPSSKPLIVEVDSKEGNARLFSRINSGTFYRLPNGVRFTAARIERNFIKIKTDPKRTYWVKLDDVKIKGISQQAQTAELNPSITINEDEKNIKINFKMNEKIPFYPVFLNGSGNLGINWFGAKLKFPDKIICNNSLSSQYGLSLTFKPDTSVSDYFSKQMNISRVQKYNWGFRAGYDDTGFNIKLKKFPLLKKENIFKGLRICIDPGHGGELTGAVGCLGYEEKEANMQIAFYLAELLTEKGAIIKLTRTADTNISLFERERTAIDFESDILISVHNNSVGGESPAEQIAGTNVFYYHPNSKLLAESITAGLQNLPTKNRGTTLENFFLTRPHEMLCVLLECVFISNPFEERLLISDNFKKEIANNIFKGLEDFLNKINN